MSRILVTGAAGFIGFHLAKKLLAEGHRVTGLDNFNDYYEVDLKENRIKNLLPFKNFTLIRDDLVNKEAVFNLFKESGFDYVLNMAAQAGVRYSIENPYAYIQSNINGFLNIIEACRNYPVKHLVYASSSSVYGANTKTPFSESDNVDHPVSLYAATKKSNELMAFTYSHLYGIPTTGLRFFTVYGPWGRPDMSPILFARAISEGKPIEVFNYGKMMRDFTYIDDIVDGIFRVMNHIPEDNRIKESLNVSKVPYKVYNIGNNEPVELLYYIKCIEKELGKEGIKDYKPLQPGDVIKTYADIGNLTRDTGFKPKTSIEKGIKQFINWFKVYYGK